MVVQICCSVDSHYFIKRLKEEYPRENIIGYFYDPNIHPYSEFLLRYEDAKRSCESLGVEIYQGEYKLDEWFMAVKGLENEPERGERCQVCFDFRLKECAKFAKSLGESLITTTLFMSPKKSHDQLKLSLEKISAKYGINSIAPDFRKGGGTKEQFRLAKKDSLYHQNYCGCIFGLKSMKKESLEFELISPLNKQILPNSVEDRLGFYKNLRNLEKTGDKFRVEKDKFINYRLLFGRVKFNEKVVKSYFLYGSHFERNLVKFEIPNESEYFYSNKSQVRIYSFKKFCEISGLKFNSFDEFLKNPLSVDSELKFREKVLKSGSFSPIIIVQNIPKSNAIIEVSSKLYDDIREILVSI